MPHEYFSLNCRAALLAAIAAAYPVIDYAAPAAQVDFAVGNVTAVGANGQSRALGKGAQIEQGDTVNTNGGRAQLRFTDGAYVSLQPESQFRIDQYRYDGKQDGNEKGFFSLLKGGLRTITGLVGRTNKSNYQVTTSVATIGIRGTEYTIQYGQSITGAVGEGQIEVCNSGGCLNVTNGESYYVQGQEFKPVLTNKRTDLPPPPPEAPPQAFKQNETVDSNGDPCALFPVQCGLIPAPPLPQLLTGTGDFHVAYATQFSSGVELAQPVVLDSGQLISFTRFQSATAVTGPYSEVDGDNIIVWGRAANPSGGESLHYVVGVPTLDFSALGGMTATYTLLGATSITDSSNNVIGKLTAMTMSADFFSSNFASLGVSMSMTLGLPSNPQSRNPTGTGTFTIASGAKDPSFSFIASDDSASVNGQGFFAGKNAIRAGFVYNVSDNNLDITGRGAGALKQTGLVASPPR
jgi:hypothetical protein